LTYVKKVSGKGETITVEEALALCLKNKYPITKMGLIYIGKKENWIAKIDKHLVVNRDALFLHIRLSKKRVPFGWVTISSMRYLTEKNNAYYFAIKRSNIEIRIYGREKKRYARKKDIKRIFKENK